MPLKPGLLPLVAIVATVALAPAHAQTPSQRAAPAYYVAEFDLTDPEGIKPYSAQVDASFKKFGGRYLVRGGTLEALEGETPKPRIIIIQFDSMAKAREWYSSAEYAALRPIRQSAGETDVYLVEGFRE